jgi:predicted O-methyltransferase YrrM
VAGRTFLHYVNVVAGRETPETQTIPAERQLIADWVRGRKVIAEIGVFEGFTTAVMARAADPDATIYAVDPFFRGRLGVSWSERIARHGLRSFVRRGRVKFVRTLSDQVGEQVPARVDFTFLDGDHSLEGIARDWAFWTERCVPGGVIALHDTAKAPEHPDVEQLGSYQYFESTIRHDPRFEFIAQAGCLTVMRRKS